MLNGPSSELSSGGHHLRLLRLTKRGDLYRATRLLSELEHAAASGHERLAAVLEAEDEHEDGTALIWAVNHRFEDFADRLLLAGASVNARTTNSGLTALHVAAERGSASLVRRLVEQNASINARSNLGDTACHLAAYHGHVDTVRVLLQLGTNWTLRNWRSNDVIEEALANNSTAIVSMVLSFIRSTSDCRRKQLNSSGSTYCKCT